MYTDALPQRLLADNRLGLSKSWVAQANDFGSEVIPGAQAMGKHIQAYLFDGYWEDIGTIEAFYSSNLALTDHPNPAFRWVLIRLLRPISFGSTNALVRDLC